MAVSHIRKSNTGRRLLAHFRWLLGATAWLTFRAWHGLKIDVVEVVGTVVTTGLGSLIGTLYYPYLRF